MWLDSQFSIGRTRVLVTSQAGNCDEVSMLAVACESKACFFLKGCIVKNAQVDVNLTIL
jgi:hypothetical protein